MNTAKRAIKNRNRRLLTSHKGRNALINEHRDDCVLSMVIRIKNALGTTRKHALKYLNEIEPQQVADFT